MVMHYPSSVLSPEQLKLAIVPDPLRVSAGISVMQAIALMTESCSHCKTTPGDREDLHTFYQEIRSSCVLVMEEGQIIGIVTERDIVRLSADQAVLDELPVEVVMARPVVTLLEHEFTDLLGAVNLLKKHKIRHLPILDTEQQVLGIVTHDSLRQITQPISLLRSRSVAEVMTTEVVCARPTTSLLQISRLMADKRVSSVLLTEFKPHGDQALAYPVGILTERDVVQFQSLGLGLARYPAGNLMSSPVFTVKPMDTLWMVQDQMQQHFIRRLVVTGELGELQGIVTQTSILEVLQPLELYRLSELLESEVARLKAERQILLENHTQTLEHQIASQNQVLQRRIEQEKLVSMMTTQIQSSLNLSKLLDTIVRELRHILNCERVNIWQFINTNWDAKVIAESSFSDFSLLGFELKNSCFKEKYADLYRQGRIRIVSDVYNANLAPEHLKMLEEIHTRSKIVVPILLEEQLWGLLNVSEGQFPRSWKPDEVEFVTILTSHVSLALQQIKIHEQLQTELEERQESEAILQHLIAGTSATTGPSFFPALVQHIAEALNVACVMLVEIQDQRFQTLAVWQDGQLRPNFSYDLQTPCTEGLEDRHCHCLDWPQGLLPGTLGQISPESCLGVTLENHDGQTIGILRILDSRRLDNPRIKDLLKPFAARVSAELERQRVTIALEQANVKLEAKVAARTAELQKAEAKYREIYEYAVEGIYQSSLDGQFLMVNLALAYLYGYDSPESLMGQHIDLKQNLYVEADRWDVFQNMIAETGFLVNFESEIYRRDGTTLWISESGRLVKDEEEKPLYYEIIVYDISDRKDAQVLLQEMTQRLRLASDSAGLGIWDYDVVNNRLVWDDRMFELYGVQRSDFCGAYEAWQMGLHPDDRSRAETELQVAIDGGKEFHTEFRVLWPNGEIRHIEAHAVTLRDAAGRGIRMIGVNKDITEKKEAALKLLRQQIRLENMSQLGQVGAWELDLRSQVLYWSPMTKVIHDVPPDYEPQLETAIGFYKPKYQEQIRLAVDEALEFGVPWHVEAELVTAIGREIWVAATGQSEMDNGVCRRLFGSFQDISGRKSVEHQLIKAKETAEKALEAKSNFLAMMSHEIRTPMNGVIGMLNLLQKTSLDDGQRSQVRIALSSAESLLLLINDILDFSKVDSGKLDLEVVEFDLIQYIGECVQSLSLKAQEKNIELVLDLRGIHYHEAHVKGDPGRLRQILTNLINNAIKFTEHGEVLVKCNLISQGQKLVFQGIVQDTGIGIPVDKQEELFSSFNQAHSTRTYGGTGLGLAICKKLCALMGGTIAVSSEEGLGSQFIFTILLEPGESTETSPRLPRTGDLNNLSVLVVDDNATNREVLAGQLQAWGTQVVTTADAQAALAICSQRMGDSKAPFDLAILDMKMPDVDGAQLSQNLKDDPRFREMPLLMMSSVGGYHEAQNFADLGFSAYLVKPVNPSDLFTALLMVHNGGQPLLQAGKILTQHYIQSFDFSSPLQRQWLENVQILLVEDSPVNQAVAQGLLKELGLTHIDVAFNGQEALVALRRSLKTGPGYTLVLMDCQMPEMDGYTASRAIRAGEAGVENQNIPIIAMTAYAMAGDRQRYLEAGMSDYVTKPIGLKALSQVLHQWLSPDLPVEESLPPTCEVDWRDGSALEFIHLPIFDREGLLDRVCGQVDLAQNFCQAFLQGIPSEIQKLHDALGVDDWLVLEQKSHSLRSSAGMIGAERLKKLATQLEQLAKDKTPDRDTLEFFLVNLDQQFLILLEMLSDFIQQS